MSRPCSNLRSDSNSAHQPNQGQEEIRRTAGSPSQPRLGESVLALRPLESALVPRTTAESDPPGELIAIALEGRQVKKDRTSTSLLKQVDEIILFLSPGSPLLVAKDNQISLPPLFLARKVHAGFRMS